MVEHNSSLVQHSSNQRMQIRQHICPAAFGSLQGFNKSLFIHKTAVHDRSCKNPSYLNLGFLAQFYFCIYKYSLVDKNHQTTMKLRNRRGSVTEIPTTPYLFALYLQPVYHVHSAPRTVTNFAFMLLKTKVMLHLDI